jgi:hydrogenase-4 component B
MTKKMPLVSLFFIIGALAISAMPPLNGFISELLIYNGLLKILSIPGESGLAAAGAVALAMIGALAAVCFIKVFGTIFLGNPRSDSGNTAHDPQLPMILPMILLSIICLIIGIFPFVTFNFVNASIKSWHVKGTIPLSLSTMLPSQMLSIVGLILIVFAALIFLILKLSFRFKKGKISVTWDCGYAKPARSMQYTGSSFSRTLTRMFAFILFPKQKLPNIKGSYPEPSLFKSVILDAILDRLILPIFYFFGINAIRIRIFQQGKISLYLMYILIITIILLFFSGLGV